MPKFCYRYSIGNSNEGQVGMCFDIVLEQEQLNEDEAVEQCKKELDEYGAESCMTGLDILPSPFAHICVYVNPEKITKDDIEDAHEVKDED